MERQERELMNYFGESATFLLKDGFRFHQDSGLMGNSALLHYRSLAMATESQKDTSIVEFLSEKYQTEEAQLKTEEIEKRKRSAISYWWLVLLLPVFWFIGKRRFC